MTLTDGAVAVLADQAAELIPGEVAVRISPTAADDPYRWANAGAWTVHFDVGPDDDSVGIWVPGSETPLSALHRLVDGLDELSETTRFYGTAFPRCLPGHVHPARVEVGDDEVIVRCPTTGTDVARLRPQIEPE